MMTVPLFAAFARNRNAVLLAGVALFCLGCWALLVLGLWSVISFLVQVLP